MSRKRHNTSSPEPDESPFLKRARPSEDSENRYGYPSRREQEHSRIDIVYGQSAAFPGLGNSDELFYGPANDGIEYLRMVR